MSRPARSRIVRELSRGLLRLRVLSAAALLASLSVGAVSCGSPSDVGAGLAVEATVTASSTALGHSARSVVAAGDAGSSGDWQSAGETSGAWIELSWPGPHVLHQVVVARPVTEPGVTDGFLSFSDGSFLQVRLSPTSPRTVVPISPRTVDRVRFTASAVSPGADHVTVSAMDVDTSGPPGDVATDAPPGGDVAPRASSIRVEGSAASDPRALVDGSGAPGAAGAGGDWTVDRPTGASVELRWPQPRELSSVALLGSPGPGPHLRAATLMFEDGTQLPVGEVLGEPDRPTVLGFMPRVTRSLRLTVDRVDGPGPLVLGALRAYLRGSTPPRSSGCPRRGSVSRAAP